MCFSAGRSGFVLGRDVWDTPLQRDDSGLADVLERHAQMLMAQLPRVSDAIGRLRAAIRDELKGGDPSLDNVARKLGTSQA